MPLQFEARKVALKQDRTGYVLTLSLHPDEIPDELLRDFVGARYACVLVRINDDESAMQYGNRVSKAGMLCREPYFQRFMASAHGADGSEDGAANALCKQCGIVSRTELNGNESAKNLFDLLEKEYGSWRFPDDPF
jgi:hypothetical protein